MYTHDVGSCVALLYARVLLELRLELSDLLREVLQLGTISLELSGHLLGGELGRLGWGRCFWRHDDRASWAKTSVEYAARDDPWTFPGSMYASKRVFQVEMGANLRASS